MAQAPGPGIAALTRGFAQLSITQKLGFLVVIAALVAVVSVALLWARTPEYRVLYSLTFAVRCRIHCRQQSIGTRTSSFTSAISNGVECRCLIR